MLCRGTKRAGVSGATGRHLSRVRRGAALAVFTRQRDDSRLGCRTLFERSRLPLEALQAQDESALNKLLESLLPAGLERAFEDADAALGERIAAIKPLVGAIDPTLSGAVDTTVDRMRDTLKTLNSKIIQAAKRKDETLRRQFTRTRALTFPGGTPQERALCVVFFLNRYGGGLGHRLLAMLPLETDHHYILTL